MADADSGGGACGDTFIHGQLLPPSTAYENTMNVAVSPESPQVNRGIDHYSNNPLVALRTILVTPGSYSDYVTHYFLVITRVPPA